MSKFEDRIAGILWENKINYKREKTFPDLRGGKFRYDFYLPDFSTIIECNGQQHYYEVWGGRAQFLKQQENDRRKISYALANNMKIYCIPYWEIKNLITLDDLFNKKFIAHSKWKNDLDWKEHEKNK